MDEPEKALAEDGDRPAPASGHSRRAFLVSAAGLTGVAVASGAWLAPARAATPAPAAGADPTASIGAGDVINLTLDGASAGVILSAEGGDAFADVIADKTGALGVATKHIGNVKYNDFKVQCGAALSKSMYQWIKSSFDLTFTSHSGVLVEADFQSKEVSTTQFANATISELDFPALDASSKDAAKMTIKFSPEYTRFSPSGGTAPPVQAQTQKKWLSSNFKVSIDGLDTSRVSKIDAITITQSAATVGNGGKEPASIEFPDLSIQLPESAADTWWKWHEDFVINGNNGPDQEKSGQLTFLAADGSTVFSLGLQGLGIFKLTPDKMEAGSENIRMVSAGLYCDQMTFTIPPTVK